MTLNWTLPATTVNHRPDLAERIAFQAGVDVGGVQRGLECVVVIDPTAPTVLDVHDFRRAGDFKRVRRSAPAPAGIANPVLEVVPDTEIQLELILESVIDGVLVTGEVQFPTAGVCSRCLEGVSEVLVAPFSELYLWAEPAEVDPDDDPLPLVQAGLIDLADAVRDAIVLAMPLAPVCDEECLGLCVTCGVRLADEPDHSHREVDPRWAVLTELELPPDVSGDSGVGNT